MEMKNFNIYPCVKTELIIGTGSVDKAGTKAKQLGAGKVLIITDEGVQKAGLLEGVEKALEKEGLAFEIWNKVVPEPTEESWNDVAEAVREKKYQVIIGIGGGSSMDTAKAAAVFSRNLGKPREYVGLNLVKNMPAPMILIPTTSGTGSEVTMAAGVTLQPERVKDFIFDPKIVPDVGIVDPLLAKKMPPKLTAATGADALSHAIGALMSTMSNPVTDAEAMKCVELVSKYLRRAYYNGDDMEARYHMAVAATLGGLAILNGGISLEHAIAQTFGPAFNIPHGVSCGISLPYAMKYILPVMPNRMAQIATVMGEDISGLTTYQAARKGVEAVKKLMRDVEIPTLQKLNVPKEDLLKLVDDLITSKSRQSGGIKNCPRKVTSESLIKLFEEMWAGK